MDPDHNIRHKDISASENVFAPVPKPGIIQIRRIRAVFKSPHRSAAAFLDSPEIDRWLRFGAEKSGSSGGLQGRAWRETENEKKRNDKTKRQRGFNQNRQ